MEIVNLSFLKSPISVTLSLFHSEELEYCIHGLSDDLRKREY